MNERSFCSCFIGGYKNSAFTGIAISPGMEPTFGWLVETMGGRQSARSLHFIFAFALAGFFVVHVLLVLLSGAIGQIRAMISGGSQA